MKDFSEASLATEELFTQDQQPDEIVQGESYQEVEDTANPPEETPNETDVVGDAVDEVEEQKYMTEETMKAAEIATQAATEKDAQLQEALRQMEAIKAQNMQLQEYITNQQNAIDELSAKNQEKIVDEVMTPPVLDINGLAFADETEQQEAMARFAQELSAYNKKQLMDELAPAIEYAKKGMYDAEKNEVVEALSQIPELQGIKEMLPQLDKMIAKNRWLSSDDMPIEDKYINAYAMVKGVNSINNPPQPEREKTAEEIFELYKNNPEVREFFEKDMLNRAKQSQQVPPMSASSGAVNAALNINEKPKTLSDASKRTEEMFKMHF